MVHSESLLLVCGGGASVCASAYGSLTTTSDMKGQGGEIDGEYRGNPEFVLKAQRIEPSCKKRD